MLPNEPFDPASRRSALLRSSALLTLVLSAAVLTGCRGKGPDSTGQTLPPIDVPQKQTLSDNWYLVRASDAEADAKQASEEDFRMNDFWFRAVVPGTVLTSYYEAGIIDDPYYSDNLKNLDQKYYDTRWSFGRNRAGRAEPSDPLRENEQGAVHPGGST